MDPSDFYVLGDSWMASYVDGVGDTWSMCDALGVRPENRRAVSGSRAYQWASDFEGRLSRALAADCRGYIVSIGGNDANEYISGGVTADEATKFVTDVTALYAALASTGKPVVAVLYDNPFPGRSDAAFGVLMLNSVIRGCCRGASVFQSSSVLSAEDMPGKGIHPGPSGYAKIAAGLARLVGGL